MSDLHSQNVDLRGLVWITSIDFCLLPTPTCSTVRLVGIDRVSVDVSFRSSIFEDT